MDTKTFLLSGGIFEYFLHMDHKDAEKKLARKADKQGDKIEELRLFTAALLELLLKKQLIAPEELAECVQRLDMSDGFSDGKTDVELTANGPKKCTDARDFMDAVGSKSTPDALNDLVSEIEKD